jgi:hypothetical protein
VEYKGIKGKENIMDFWNEFVAGVNIGALVTIVVLILANLFFGLVLAIKGGKLELVKLGDWITKRIIPYGLGYLGTVAIAALPTLASAEYAEWFKALPITVFVFIVATFVGKLKEQLQALGLPIPNLPFEAKTPPS